MPVTSTSASATPTASAAAAAAAVAPRTQPVPVHGACETGGYGVGGPAEHATRLSAPAAAQARPLFAPQVRVPQVRVPQVREAAVHRLRQRTHGVVGVRKDRIDLSEQEGKVLEKVARLRRRRVAAEDVRHEL